MKTKDTGTFFDYLIVSGVLFHLTEGGISNDETKAFQSNENPSFTSLRAKLIRKKSTMKGGSG